MRKPIRIAPVVSLIVGLVIIACLASSYFSDSPRGPLYKGKSLSAWLDGYVLTSNGHPDVDLQIDENNKKVDLIVREIGTNSIPALLEMLELSDSPLKTKMAEFLDDHNIRIFKIKPSWPRNIEAGMAFRALGEKAIGAEPRLVALLKENRGNSYKEDLFAATLGGIGPAASNAVPSLLEVVTNRSALPNNFLKALGEIHAQPEKVIPVLTTFLKSPDAGARLRAVISLRAYGAEARSAVPALLGVLKDNDEHVRQHAAEALKAIDADVAAKAGLD